MSVDLPLPDGPESTTQSPACTWRVTPARTGRRMPPRRCRVNPLASPSVRSITGAMMVPRDRARAPPDNAASWEYSCVQDRADEELRVGVLRVIQNLVG